MSVWRSLAEGSPEIPSRRSSSPCAASGLTALPAQAWNLACRRSSEAGLAGIPNADTYFNLVFFIVLTSIVLQGTTISLMAKWLGVNAPSGPARRPRLEYEARGATGNDLIEITVPPDSTTGGRRVMDLGLPAGALIALLIKGENTIAPGGGTVIEAGDTLLIFARKEDHDEIHALFDAAAPASVELSE